MKSIGPTITKLSLGSMDAYVHYLLSQHTSPAGIFGIEVSWPQFQFVEELVDIRRYFGEPPLVVPSPSYEPDRSGRVIAFRGDDRGLP